MRTGANICEHMRTYANICEVLRNCPNICEHMRKYASICENLRTYANICEHANLCENMRKSSVRKSANVVETMRNYANLCENMRTSAFRKLTWLDLASLQKTLVVPNGAHCAPLVSQAEYSMPNSREVCAGCQLAGATSSFSNFGTLRRKKALS